MITRRIVGWLVHLRDHGFSSGSNGYLQTNGLSVPIIMNEPILFPMLLLLAVIWLLPHTPLPTHLHTTLNTTYHAIPAVHVDYHPTTTTSPLTLYPHNKTALYLEPRPLPFLIPLLLHMLAVIPQSWSILFLGSAQTAEMARSSHTASRYEKLGKLRILDLEKGEGERGKKWSEAWGRRWDDLSVEEMGNRLLTNLTFYEDELVGTEWLMVWHSDAILCANAERDLEEWIGWDWVGAPWAHGGQFGGSGGLSIRNMEKVKEVLRFQNREDNAHSEDQWLSSRMGLLPDAKMCPVEKEREWAVQDVWHEWPMGYHVNPKDLYRDVWEPQTKRQQIYGYCPEIKIILDMKLEREKCPQPVKLDTIFDLSSVASAEKENPSGHAMTKEEYAAQFSKPSDQDADLKEQIKDLEKAMEEMKKDKESDEDVSESEDTSQELGEPKIADFVHVEDVFTEDESEDKGEKGDGDAENEDDEVEDEDDSD